MPTNKFQIEIQQQIVLVTIFGEWNGSDMKKFIYQVKSQITPLINSRWAVITDISQWQLGTPELQQESASLQQWCIENGQVCEAIVGADALKAFQSEQILGGLNTHNIKIKYCADIDSAKHWINTILNQ